MDVGTWDDGLRTGTWSGQVLHPGWSPLYHVVLDCMIYDCVYIYTRNISVYSTDYKLYLTYCIACVVLFGELVHDLYSALRQGWPSSFRRVMLRESPFVPREKIEWDLPHANLHVDLRGCEGKARRPFFGDL